MFGYLCVREKYIRMQKLLTFVTENVTKIRVTTVVTHQI